MSTFDDTAARLALAEERARLTQRIADLEARVERAEGALAFLDGPIRNGGGLLSLSWEPHTILAHRNGHGWVIHRLLPDGDGGDDGDGHEHLTTAGPWEQGDEEDSVFLARVTFPSLLAAVIAYVGPGALPALVAEKLGELEQARARAQELERENADYEALRERTSSILTRTANVLKGEPPALGMHSWHDLPEKADELQQRMAKLERQLERTAAIMSARRRQLEARQQYDAYWQGRGFADEWSMDTLNKLAVARREADRALDVALEALGEGSDA
jgi:hypothetical protein